MLPPFWNDPVNILYILIGILLIDKLWYTYLMLREIALVYHVNQVPEVLLPYLSVDLFNAMRAYKLHKSWLMIVNTLWVIVICGCLELYFGFYAYLWQLANMVAFAHWMQHEVVVSIIFACMFHLYLLIKSLPTSLYEKYCIVSLIKPHPVKWYVRIINLLLDALVSILVLIIVVVILVYLAIALQDYAFLALLGLAILLTGLIILLLPFLIDPFLGKRVPLTNRSLKSDLEQLTSRVGFPMRQVHVIKVRDPNTGSNAFFYGSCCLKRIVIFDTLLMNRGQRNSNQLAPEDAGKGLRDDQVIAVVAHELGHWKLGHFYKGLAMFGTHLLLTLLLFGLCFPHGPIYQAVGFEPGLQPIFVGYLIIFGYVLTPYFTLSNVLMLTATRYFEYEADEFAYRLGYAATLRQALLKLYADNLSFPISDDCYSIFHHTHPTMLRRLARLEELEQRQQ